MPERSIDPRFDNIMYRVSPEPGPAHRIRPRLRALEAAALPIVNAFAPGRCWPCAWRDRQWTIHITSQIAPPDIATGMLLALSWKSVSGYLALPHNAATTLLSTQYGEADWDDLAPDLVLALLQNTVDDLAAGSTIARSSAIRINDFCRQENLPAKSFAFALRLLSSDEDELLIGHFLTDLAGAKYLARYAGSPPPTGRVSDWSNLPLAVALELGWVDVPLQILHSLRIQDILFSDGWWAGADNKQVCLRISPTLGIAAECSDNALLRALTKVKRMEQESLDQTSENALPASPLDTTSLADVPVRLTFDLGERNITLRELADVTAGHIFDLGLAPDRSVNLRVNGVRIGEGELIDIDGRIGVAISRIAPPHP